VCYRDGGHLAILTFLLIFFPAHHCCYTTLFILLYSTITLLLTYLLSFFYKLHVDYYTARLPLPYLALSDVRPPFLTLPYMACHYQWRPFTPMTPPVEGFRDGLCRI